MIQRQSYNDIEAEEKCYTQREITDKQMDKGTAITYLFFLLLIDNFYSVDVYA